MIVREHELDEKGRPLIDWVKPVEWLLPNAEVYKEWKEDDKNGDVDFIELYESEDENGDGSEDSDDVYGEEENEEDEEGIEDIEEGEEEADEDIDMTGAGETSGLGFGRRRGDVDTADSASSSLGLYSEAAENRFRASIQEIGERLLGRAMTPKDLLTSPEEQQDYIKYIITKRKRFLAGNARLIIDLRWPLGKMLRNKGLTLKRWIESTARWIDRPTSAWLAMSSLAA